jgi:hypothetical protein
MLVRLTAASVKQIITATKTVNGFLTHCLIIRDILSAGLESRTGAYPISPTYDSTVSCKSLHKFFTSNSFFLQLLYN